MPESKRPLIPREVLFGDPERAGVRISPDGKYLAWLAPKEGILNVWVAPLERLEEAKPVTNDTVRPIHDYGWAYTSRHLQYLQDSAGDENFHVFRVDLEEGRTTDLTPFPGARAAIGALDSRQPTKIVVEINDRDARFFDLHEVDLLTGARRLLVQNEQGFLGFVIDQALRPRLALKKLPTAVPRCCSARRGPRIPGAAGSCSKRCPARTRTSRATWPSRRTERVCTRASRVAATPRPWSRSTCRPGRSG